MTTPSPRARKVAQKILSCVTEDCEHASLPVCKAYIGDAIDAACAEAVREEKKSYFTKFTLSETITDQIEHAYAKGFSDARERAAKRVENHLGKPCTLVCHCGANAKAIRQLPLNEWDK